MNSKLKPPKQPTFFLDHSLGTIKIRLALENEGVAVEVLADHFDVGAEDIVWLSEVGKRGWIVLTKDKMIRKRNIEINTLVSSGVPAFVLTAGGLSGEEMGQIFVRALPAMLRFVEKNPPPFIATISRKGNVSKYYP
ncbi:MAG: hypothetical protein V3V56_06975 [bacterium]